MTETILLVVAALLVALGGLLAALDSALGVTTRSDLIEWSLDARASSSLRGIAEDIPAHTNAAVFFRILTETSAAVLVTVAFTVLFENIWWAMVVSALLMTGVSFVLVGASPRAVGRRNASGLLRAFAPLVRFVRILLGPVAGALVALGRRVTPGGGRSVGFTSEEQLLNLVDEAADAELIEDDDRELIHSVFDFTDAYVRELMIPRTDMVTIEADATTDDAMELFLRTGVSRVPVLAGDVDEVVGILYLKDLVQLGFGSQEGWRTQGISQVLRPAAFVPESMKAESLLQQMKREAVHVCIVVDEHGGTSGLVTLEDLLEEIVGDIADEYDTPQSEVVELEPGRYRVSARLPLGDLGDLFGIDLDDEDVDSVGGLLGKALGRVPQPGAQATSAGIVMTGGASKGRGRGISTVFVEASEELRAVEEAFAPATGEVATVNGREGRRRRTSERTEA